MNTKAVTAMIGAGVLVFSTGGFVGAQERPAQVEEGSRIQTKTQAQAQADGAGQQVRKGQGQMNGSGGGGRRGGGRR
jgi:hypothetical protein